MSKEMQLKVIDIKLQAYRKIVLQLENEMEELYKEKDQVMEVE
jgi:hypothetical protein